MCGFLDQPVYVKDAKADKEMGTRKKVTEPILRNGCKFSLSLSMKIQFIQDKYGEK